MPVRPLWKRMASLFVVTDEEDGRIVSPTVDADEFCDQAFMHAMLASFAPWIVSLFLGHLGHLMSGPPDLVRTLMLAPYAVTGLTSSWYFFRLCVDGSEPLSLRVMRWLAWPSTATIHVFGMAAGTYTGAKTHSVIRMTGIPWDAIAFGSILAVLLWANVRWTRSVLGLSLRTSLRCIMWEVTTWALPILVAILHLHRALPR